MYQTNFPPWRARRAGHTGEGRKAGVAKMRKEGSEPGQRPREREEAPQPRAFFKSQAHDWPPAMVSHHHPDNNRDYDLAKGRVRIR